MSLAELMPALQVLSRAEKLQVIQVLAADLACEEAAALIPPGASCPVWSPFEAFGAARVLTDLLEKERATS
jgi:hypothetical protein